MHDFQQGKQPEKRRWRGKERERERERERRKKLTIIEALPQLHASSKIVFNEGL